MSASPATGHNPHSLFVGLEQSRCTAPGLRDRSDGTDEVELRNPWGDVVPGNMHGNGIFYLSMTDFGKYFLGVSVTSPSA